MFQKSIISTQTPQACQKWQKFNLVGNFGWQTATAHQAQGLVMHEFDTVALFA
tara:strand:+ start:1101 stop:1259 length:159 start_codon:yes stop_codon:yes gene_type:complete